MIAAPDAAIDMQPENPITVALGELRARMSAHPFWDGPLLAAAAAGALTREDYRYIFGQYYLYSKNFTRYVSGVMANCENDYFRSRLSENLWEEGGGCEPDKRHSQIFRGFLYSLGVDEPDKTEFADATRHFVREYLDACLRGAPIFGSAFLSFGTEGIVARLYTIFVAGMRKAGIPEEDLDFFKIHMACDDAHARTLEEMVASYGETPGWFETCAAATDHALSLRARFFDSLFQTLRQRRVQGIMDRIQARRSLVGELPDGGALWHRADAPGNRLYANEIKRLHIKFSVDRVPFSPEVLDARVVRIPAGRNNERHRHAHETVFYFVEGSGQVLVDDRVIEVRAGDCVFVPRWAMHQTQNTGLSPMTILAVTDFNLTGKAFVGDYEKTARMKRRAAAPVLAECQDTANAGGEE